MKQKVMFISSLGGHLTQLLQLNSLFNDYNYVLVTEESDITRDLATKYNIRYLKHTSRDNLFLFFVIVIINCFLSLYYFIKYNPKVIVSTGANTAAAMCCLGKIFGKKVIFIESFAKMETPSITGKMIYKLHAYTTFVVQWEAMLKFYPKAEYWGGVY